MRSATFSPIVAAGLAMLLAACETPPPMGAFDDFFGNAVNHNIAVQTVNPDPPDADQPPTFDGARTQLMTQRYEADKVRRPRDIRTTDISIINLGDSKP